MSKASAVNDLLDRLVDAIERIQRDLPMLVALGGEWKRGYVGVGNGTAGGKSDLTAPERIAIAKDQPDRDIADYLADLEQWADQGLRKQDRGGLDLDGRRAHLVPLKAEAARKLVDGDVGLCRTHLRAGIKVPLLRDDGARGDLCRWCYDFARPVEAGGYGVDPPVAVVRRKHETGRVERRFIEAELAPKANGKGRRAKRQRRSA